MRMFANSSTRHAVQTQVYVRKLCFSCMQVFATGWGKLLPSPMTGACEYDSIRYTLQSRNPAQALTLRFRGIIIAAWRGFAHDVCAVGLAHCFAEAAEVWIALAHQLKRLRSPSEHTLPD